MGSFYDVVIKEMGNDGPRTAALGPQVGERGAAYEISIRCMAMHAVRAMDFSSSTVRRGVSW